MDAIEEQAWQAPIFRKSRLLYLHCIDPYYVSELTIPSLPFLKLKCLFGHVSFPGFLSERRMVVFPMCKRVLDKMKDIDSPCVIEVKPSVEFQIHPDEIEDDAEVMLIWDFEVDSLNLSLTASKCLVKAKNPSSVNRIPSMPYLDLDSVDCNCSKSSRGEKTLRTTTKDTSATGAASRLQKLSLSDLNEEDSSEEEEEEEEEEEGEDEDFSEVASNEKEDSNVAKLFAPETVYDAGVELFTETFTLKGCSFHEHFQTALKICKQKMVKEEPLPIQLSFEPVNRRDENAILVHACHEGSWKPVGYIPGKKVAKVTKAITSKEITDMAINSIKYQYVFAIECYKYFASIRITKKGRWLKNKDTYEYNEEL